MGRVWEHAMIHPQQKKPKLVLSNTDGNAFIVIGKAMRALRNAGYSEEQITKYRLEATSSDYDHLLTVTMEWCDVE